jgi:hypothetical protein
MKYTLFIFILIILGCSGKKNISDYNRIISEMLLKHPQLSKGKVLQTNSFKNIRTISLESKNVQLRLWRTPDSSKERIEILVLTNAEGQSYAIPLPSNKYRDYWNFECDTHATNYRKFNTTFAKEFMNAMCVLKFQDSVGTCNIILEEFLKSVIHTKEVYTLSDSILSTSVSVSSEFNENRDSCQYRIAQNIAEMRKGVNKPDGLIYNALWDEKNNRIFQIVFRNKTFSVNCDFTIKVYRQDCNYFFEEL